MTQYQQAQLAALKWRREYHIGKVSEYHNLCWKSTDLERIKRFQRRMMGHANEAWRCGEKYHRLLIIANRL